MPAVTIDYPRGFFDDPGINRAIFRKGIKELVARGMKAIDPFSGEVTMYEEDPDKFIDLLLRPYDPEDAELTAVCLGTIVTYDWPDRMEDIDERIEVITRRARSFIPDALVPVGMDGISFTFLGKVPGAWAAA